MAFPNEISTPFLLKDTGEDVINKAVGFANNISEHLRTHYSIYVSQDLASPGSPSDFNILDMIYYHVYGDYRFSLEGNTAVYKYQSAPPQNTLDSLSAVTKGDFMNFVLSKEANYEGQLKGMLVGEALDTEMAATEWFQRELRFNTSASKFHLPSLGTMAMATLGVKPNNLGAVKKSAKEMLTLMADFIMDNRAEEQIPKFLRDNFDAATVLGSSRVKNNAKIFHAIHEALVSHPDYLDLVANQPEQTPDISALEKALDDAYKFESMPEAASGYIDSLLQAANLKFNMGMPVRLTSSGVKKHASALGLTPTEAKAVEWIVVSATPSAGGGKKQKGPKGIFGLMDRDDETVLLGSVTHSEIELSIVTLEDEVMFEKAATKKEAITNPFQMVFSRIILDILFTFEAVLYMSSIRYNQSNLDLGINISKTKVIVERNYPKMKHINDKPFDPNVVKDSPGTIATLVSLRSQHTLAFLANMMHIGNKAAIEGFYKEDLRLAEVLWLAGALTDEGKAVFERKETPNLLAQLQYRIKGVGEGIDAEAPVNAKTVFYKMDAPILKDVIMKYDQLFIAFTITNSFMPKDKKKKDKSKKGGGPPTTPDPNEDNIRIGELVNALWGSILGRSSDIVNREGVQPHLIFSRLFGLMEQVSAKLYFAELYPSQWTGTNTATRVSRDPLILGEEIEMKFYNDCMNQYISHLKNNFGGQPAVASAVLTVLGEIVILAEDDIDTLRESFIARIKSQAKRPMLKGTDIRFDPYRAVMCVMRTEIDIPLNFREAFVAQKLDESQREQIKKTFSSESKLLVLPETHPEFKPIDIEEPDEETALFGLENPNDLPQPKFYPKPGSILNKNHPEVAKLLNNLIGPRTEAFFPIGSLFSLATQKWTPQKVKDVKKSMLKRDTTYTVMPIAWKGETKIWDGRDNDQQPPNPSVVTHYRDNFGIIFSIDTPDFNPFEFDILAGSLTDYETILYRKYTNDKFDTANYVYTPPDGVFKNPNMGVYSKTGNYRTSDPDFTVGNSFMIYRGEIAPQVKPPVDKSVEIDFEPVTEKLEQLDTRVWNHGNKTVQATDKNTAAITAAGERVAKASETTGKSFEKAAQSFEAAGKEFSAAAISYENSAQEFAKIPAALKTALVEAATEMVDNLEMKFDKPIAEFDESEDSKMGREAFDLLKALASMERNSEENSDFVTKGYESIANISAMLPNTKYLYRAFTKHLQDIFVKEESSANFLDVEPKEHTGRSVRALVASSLSVGLVANIADEVMTDAQINNLTPKELKAFKWRRHCVSVIQMMNLGNYAEARRELGIEEYKEEDKKSIKEKYEEAKKKATSSVGILKDLTNKAKKGLKG